MTVFDTHVIVRRSDINMATIQLRMIDDKLTGESPTLVEHSRKFTFRAHVHHDQHSCIEGFRQALDDSAEGLYSAQ